MNRNIRVIDNDISNLYTIYKKLNYGDRDIYILKGLPQYFCENYYRMSFYDDIYSMYVMIGLFNPDFERIVENNFQQEDVLTAISHAEFSRVYYTKFSEASVL